MKHTFSSTASGFLELGSGHSAPKPTPRLSKPNIRDACTANDAPLLTQSSSPSVTIATHTEIESETDRGCATTTSATVQHQSSNDSENAADRRSGDYSETKKFWESLDSQRDESHSLSGVVPPVPKPRSQVSSMGSSLLKTEESLENTSLRELSQSSSHISSEQQVEYSESSSNADAKIELARDDDSIIAEDRLEDESFPISDKFDSDGEALHRVDQEYRLDSLEYDNEKRLDSLEFDHEKSESSSAYKIKEREDILDDGDDEEEIAEKHRAEEDVSPASFYIGERSANVITKSLSDKQSELIGDSTDNTQDISQKDESISGSYDLQQDVSANQIHKRPSGLNFVAEEDRSESSRTSARVQKLEDEERTEYSHKLEFSEDCDISKPQTTKVLHSPVDAYKSYEMESTGDDDISTTKSEERDDSHFKTQTSKVTSFEDSLKKDRYDSSCSEQISNEFDQPKAQTAKVAHSPVETFKKERYDSFHSEQISDEFDAPKSQSANLVHSPVETYQPARYEPSPSEQFDAQQSQTDKDSHVELLQHERVDSFHVAEDFDVQKSQTAKMVHSPVDAYKSVGKIEGITSDESNAAEQTQRASVVHSPIQSHITSMQFDKPISIESEEIHRADAQLSSIEPFGSATERTETVVIEDMWPTSNKAKIIHSPIEAFESASAFEHPTAIDEEPIGEPQRANLIHSPIEQVNIATEIEQTYTLHSDVTDLVEKVAEASFVTNEADSRDFFKAEEDDTLSEVCIETKRPPVVHSPVGPQRLLFSPKDFDARDMSDASQLVSTLTDRSTCESLDDIPSLPKRDGSSNEDSFNKLDVVHRAHKVQIVPGTRWSVTDPENCSSSGSHYDSFEKSDSRPVSSDVENMYSTYGGVSSEYQTARDASLIPGSTEYVTAASTLDHSGKTISSQDSMKSLDSDSSGQLVSLEVSEASETLVPSTAEYDLPIDTLSQHGLDFDLDENEQRLVSLEACSGVLLEDTHEETLDSISANMKRSHEMIFQPDFLKSDTIESIESSECAAKPIEIVQPKPIESSLTGLSFEETKLGSSVEDGSLFSVSVSSTGNTIVENVQDDMASSLGSSLIGSYEMPSTLRDGITRTSFDDGQNGQIDSLVMTSSFVRDDDVNSVNTQITTISDVFSEISSTAGIEAGIEAARRNRGHRRNDSTAFVKTLDLKATSDGDDISLEDEMVVHEALSEEDRRESGSDSDYDRYETEYSRSFKKPTQRQRKKKAKLEKAEPPQKEIERKKSIPSIETIVEDVNAEIESEVHEERPPSQNMQDYSNIPDITITDDPTKSDEDDDDNFLNREIGAVDTEPPKPIQQVVQTVPEPEPTPVFESHPADEPAASRIPIRPTIPKKKESSSTYGSTTSINYAKQTEINITDEKYEELIEQQYQTKLAEQTKRTSSYRDEPLGGGDSPTSDSFEMVDVEQPDISDEFVIIEEVAKEADELMTEGKSVGIQKIKYEKKHDDEVERIVIKSAPAATNEGSRILEGRHDMAFEFEDSPPNGNDSDPNGLDSSRRWVEMQLAEQAQNLRYPYDLERGVLEDIKEEDTDFEVGSSRISSFKDSFTGTPDYEALLARRYVTSKEGDNISMSSLQEFESLEQAISLENRRYHQGSAESSNGSFPRRFNLARSAQADEISLASLKEFEGLENACLEAQLLEIKAKEEHALLLSRSDESNKSNGSPGNGKTVSKVTEITDLDGNMVRRITETTTSTVVTKASPLRISEEKVVTGFQTQPIVARAINRARNEDIDEDLSSTNIMEVSTDSLELGPKHLKLSNQGKDTLSHHDSSDSLEISKSADVMTSSIDSIEISKDKSSKSDADSIEQLLAGREPERRDSIDSIDMQYALMTQATKTDRSSLDSGNTQYTVQSTMTTSGNQMGDSRLMTSTTSMASSSGYGGGISKDISSDSLNLNQSEKELMLTSSESLTTSSTNATYQNETDSQMSSSVTSCESTTLIDTLRTRGARYLDLDDDQDTAQTTVITTSYRTVSKTSEPQDLP